MFFLVLRILIDLTIYDFFRLGHNFAQNHKVVKEQRVASTTPPADDVERVCRAFNYACVIYPKRVRCLQASTVITRRLRKRGTDAQMALGSQKIPFKAHAWVEVDGKPINERKPVQQIYLVWERC
jgi:hypothetical protein